MLTLNDVFKNFGILCIGGVVIYFVFSATWAEKTKVECWTKTDPEKGLVEVCETTLEGSAQGVVGEFEPGTTCVDEACVSATTTVTPTPTSTLEPTATTSAEPTNTPAPTGTAVSPTSTPVSTGLCFEITGDVHASLDGQRRNLQGASPLKFTIVAACDLRIDGDFATKVLQDGIEIFSADMNDDNYSPLLPPGTYDVVITHTSGTAYVGIQSSSTGYREVDLR